MRDRVSPALRALLLLGGCAAIAWVVSGVTASGDYQPGSVATGDNAAPAIDALIHGHVARMASAQPLMGLVSLIWRAPFAGLAVSLGARPQLVYQVGAAACLLSTLGLVAWLGSRARTAAGFGAAALAAAVVIAGPVTRQALVLGHPEEVLTTVLATGAVIAAGQNRRAWAAALLGLAIGSKPWAVLATPAVLVSLPDVGAALAARAAVAARAVAVAAPAVAVLPLADLGAFRRSEHLIGGLNVTTPFSLWWPVRGSILRPGVPMNLLPLSLTRSDVAAVVLIAAATAISIYARRVGRGRMPAVDGLALLALIGLLRCLADPAPLTYYFVPLVIPLAVWEAGTLRRLPVVAVLVSAALDLFPQDELAVVTGHSPFGLDVVNLVWIAAGCALAVYLVRHSFHRNGDGALARLGARVLQPAGERA